MNAGLTGAVSEICRFFGLRSDDIPCLVLVSLWDRHVFVIPIDRSFALTKFVEAVVLAFEPAADRLNEALVTLQHIDNELSGLRAARQEIKRRLDRIRTKWNEQRARSVSLLTRVGEAVPDQAAVAEAVRALVSEDTVPTSEDLSRVDGLLAVLPDNADGAALRRDVPKALRKVADRWPIWSGGLQELERRHTAVDQDEHRLRRSRELQEAQVRDVRGYAGLSDAVKEAAVGFGLSIREEGREDIDELWTWVYMQSVETTGAPATVWS